MRHHPPWADTSRLRVDAHALFDAIPGLHDIAGLDCGDQHRLGIKDIPDLLADQVVDGLYFQLRRKALLHRLGDLEADGVTLVLCSGRGVEYQRALRRRWGLDPDGPVVAENGVLQGILSVRDLLFAALSETAGEARRDWWKMTGSLM